jgi:hypothetical protein
MKFQVLILMLCTSAAVWAVDPAPPAAATLVGEVLEIKDVESYTYLRLKTANGEQWVAVGKTKTKKGAKVTIENVMMMQNFESKTLKKTFSSIAFGSLAGAGMSRGADVMSMSGGHSAAAKNTDTTPDVQVPKATGANARTVAEIVGKSSELKDKSVQVRGKVVKFNPGIMGKNWVHLRDGSGSAADGSNDILVTTLDATKLGDIVTASGVVRVGKDFGAGYSYKVLVEEASLKP